jgi:hypothetical protein
MSSTSWTAARSGENERLQALNPSTSITVTSQKLSLFNITLLRHTGNQCQASSLCVRSDPISQSTPARMAKPGRANLPTYPGPHGEAGAGQSTNLPTFHPYGSKDEKYSRT